MNLKNIKTPRLIVALLVLQFSVMGHSQYQMTPNIAGNEFFSNPIFAGDYPDPSIMRDGTDYYIVHSSFEYYQGLLIWHSTDLINWNPLVNALNQYVGSVYAPDLIKHNDKYYIYFPAGGTNFVVWADNIEGPWSNPIDLKVGNIDPGHIADDNGNRYLYFSNGGYVPLSEDGLKVTGDITMAYEGWPLPDDWIIECFCLEGPKLFKQGDYYYLTVAEGGTSGPATGHTVISARSKSPLGPWENSPYNPIARTESSEEKWWSVGHATIFDDVEGAWWMMLHGYENGHYNMGRQTLLLPVEWTADGWYKIPDGIEIDQPIKRPAGEAMTSNFTISDSFEGDELKPQWRYFKETDFSRHKIENNALVIEAKGDVIGNSSPLLTITADHSYEAQVEMIIDEGAMGGLVLMYNENAYGGILADSENIHCNIRRWQFMAEKEVIKNHVFLKIRSINDVVNMYYSLDGENWNRVETSLEVSGFHHNAFSEFMSLRVGLTAIGEGTVVFKNFRYKKINNN